MGGETPGFGITSMALAGREKNVSYRKPGSLVIWTQKMLKTN